MNDDLKKAMARILYLLVVVLGITLTICNFFKICPEVVEGNTLNNFVAFCIAYGCMIGPVFTILGIAAFFEE